MILAAPLIPSFAQAAGITAGGLGIIELTKKVSDYIRQNPEESKEIIKLISPSAAGISTLFENKKREEDNNLPSPVEEEKTPQQEPPEGEPDLLPELSKQTVEEVIRKEIKEKQQPINKIQTWDKYLTREEAEKLAKEKNLTLKDFEKPAIMKQITFKQVPDGYEIFFNKKYVGELLDITFLKQEDGTQKGKERTFNLSFIKEDGYNDEAFDTIDGIKNAKDQAKRDVADSLLRESDEINYPSLKQIYEKLEYNEKGMPKAAAEEVEKSIREIEERRNPFGTKKVKGGLMDKPLLGRSRDI